MATQTSPTQEKPDPETTDRQPQPQDDGKGKKRFWLTIAIVAGALVILFLIGLVPRLRARPALQKRAQAATDNTPQVVVVRPQQAPAATTLTLPANIQAYQETDITARATGYVRQWNVDIGDRVKPGQVVALIATPDVDQIVQQAHAQLAQSKAQVIEQQSEQARALANLVEARQNAERQRQQLVQAQGDLHLASITADRWKYLVQQGAVSQQSADQQFAAYRNNQANVAALRSALEASRTDIAAYEAAYRSAQANVAAAQENVQANEANLTRSHVLSNFKQVRAPFAGVITARDIDTGSYIGGVGGANGSTGSGGGGGATGSASGGATASAGTVASSGANSSKNAMYSAAPDTGVGESSSESTGTPGGSTASRSTSGGTATSTGASGSAGASGGNAQPAPATAPFSGSGGSASDQGVGGAAVSEGTALYHIARTDILRIQVDVPQSFAPNLHIGDHAKVIVTEFPNHTLIGTITRTASAIDPSTRTMLTEVQLRNPTGRLLPGMYAQVTFSVARSVVPLLIPDSALIMVGSGNQIATVGSDGKVHIRQVQLGRDYGQLIEVLSGLAPGDLVVQEPSDTTQENAKVKPVWPQQDSGKGRQGQQKQQGGGAASSSPSPNVGQSYGNTEQSRGNWQ